MKEVSIYAEFGPESSNHYNFASVECQKRSLPAGIKSKTLPIDSETYKLKWEARGSFKKGGVPEQFFQRYCWEKNPKYMGNFDIPNDSHHVGPTHVGPEYKEAYHDIISKEFKHFHDLASLESRIIDQLSRGYTVERVNHLFNVDQEELIRRVYKENEMEIKKRMKRLLIGRFAQKCSIDKLVGEFGERNRGLIFQVWYQNQSEIKDDLRDQLICWLAAGNLVENILRVYGNDVYALLQEVITIQRGDVLLMGNEITRMQERQEERERQKLNRSVYTQFVNDKDKHFNPVLISRIKQDLGILQSSENELQQLNDQIEELMSVCLLDDCGLL